MGKGLDTCLVVKPMVKKAATPEDVDIAERKKHLITLTSLNVQPQQSIPLGRQETVADLDKHLDDMLEIPDSDAYPTFHLLPEVLQHSSRLILLPPYLKSFIKRISSPEECLRTSRDIAVAGYQGALKKLGGARAVVCVPAPELLQDAEIRPHVLWEGMLVVRPWSDMPMEVAAMEPEVLDADVMRSGDRLDDDQKEVLTELQAIMEAAEFVHYWATKGCGLEVETDYEP